MAIKPDTEESAEYDNFLEESNKPLEKVSLGAFIPDKEPEKTPLDKAKEDDSWENHWMGMPSFTQEEAGPYKKVTVSFRTQEDFDEFAKVICQKMTAKTKSIWYPALAKDANCLKRWV